MAASSHTGSLLDVKLIERIKRYTFLLCCLQVSQALLTCLVCRHCDFVDFIILPFEGLIFSGFFRQEINVTNRLRVVIIRGRSKLGQENRLGLINKITEPSRPCIKIWAVY